MNNEDKKSDLIEKLEIIKMVGHPKLKTIAQACGTSNAAITNWIKSGNIDYMQHADPIASIFGLTPDELHTIPNASFSSNLKTIKKNDLPLLNMGTSGFLIVGEVDMAREPVRAYEVEAITEDDKREHDVFIPVININHGMSNGGPIAPEFVETKKRLAFDLEWMRKKGYHQRDLLLAQAEGDSMHPTINHKDMVLINTAQRDIIDGQIYSVIIFDQPKFKILKRSFDGGLVVISANQDPIYKDEVIPPEALEHVYIIGRAVHRSGDL